MYSIETNVADFREALVNFGVKDVTKLVADFYEILLHGDSPCRYWKCIGSGAFKECYDVGSDDIIVKFASNANETDSERGFLSKVNEAQFGEVFAPAIYLPLAVGLPVCFIEDCPSSYYRYTYHTYVPIPEDERVELVTVIIQKRIAHMANETENGAFQFFCYDSKAAKHEYSKRPIHLGDGTDLPFEEFEHGKFESPNWVQTVINKFGYAYYKELDRFLWRYNVSDLHNRNIGYLRDGTPVIFDWLI